MSNKTVFISYRRDSVGKWFAGRIYDALTTRGYDSFLDVDDVTSGRWESNTLTQVADRAHFLLLLTPNSLDRCNDETDMVRREFELALKADRNIVPVVEQFEDLTIMRESCPDSMKQLFDFQVAVVGPESFGNHIQKLVLDFIPSQKTPRPVTNPGTQNPLSRFMSASNSRLIRMFSFSKPYVPRFFDILLVAAFVVTLLQIDGSINPVYIPIAIGLKGISLLMGLPNELRAITLLALIFVVSGFTLVLVNLQSRKEFIGGRWVLGFALLAFGVGVASALMYIVSSGKSFIRKY